MIVGMYDNLLDVYKALTNDEQLLRLLHYPPENPIDKTPDPLDKSLPNILTLPIQQLHNIREECFKKTPKDDDLVDKKICRVYLYSGRRRGHKGNYAVADQQLTVDILVHNSYQESDLRMERIADRINELLSLSRVTGIGKVDYVDGDPIGTPKGYVGYRHIFVFGVSKK